MITVPSRIGNRTHLCGRTMARCRHRTLMICLAITCVTAAFHPSYDARRIMMIVRGGGSEEDALDEYIDQLISSTVQEDGEDPDGAEDRASQVEEEEKDEEESMLDIQTPMTDPDSSDESSEESESASASAYASVSDCETSVKTYDEPETQTMDRLLVATLQDEENDKDDVYEDKGENDNSNDNNNDIYNNNEDEPKQEEKQEEDLEDADSHHNNISQSDTKFTDTETRDSSLLEVSSTSSSTDTATTAVENTQDLPFNTSTRHPRHRVAPYRPNAVYRFLLQQGVIGRILAMCLMLLVEWLHIYLPQLAQWSAYLLSLVIPQEAGARHRSRRPPPPPSTTLSVRTGKKQKRQVIRQADEMALRQLQRNKNRYQFVSDEFLRRHQLGPYSVRLEDTVDESNLDEDSIHDKKEVEDEKEVETDWVLQALLKPRPNSKIQQQLIHDLDRKGFSTSIGVEISMKEHPPKSSNHDSVMGRFMSAAGANGRLSRSLLGAYPGDAVPLDQAASAEGVTWLASDRYGYGSWSDDDMEDMEMGMEEDVQEIEALHGSSRRRRRRKKKATKHTNSLGSNLGGSMRKGHGSVRSSFTSRQPFRPEPPLFRSPTLRRREDTTRPVPHHPHVRRIRPATEMLDELRARKKKKDNDD